MKKIILSLLASAVLTLALNASAAVTYRSPLQPDTIDSITIGGTGHLYIYMSNPNRMFNPASCSIRRYTIDKDSPVYDYFFTQIVLAWKEGYDVNFAVQTNRCLVSGVEVARFNVEK